MGIRLIRKVDDGRPPQRTTPKPKVERLAREVAGTVVAETKANPKSARGATGNSAATS